MDRVVAIRCTQSPPVENDQCRFVHRGAKVPIRVGMVLRLKPFPATWSAAVRVVVFERRSSIPPCGTDPRPRRLPFGSDEAMKHACPATTGCHPPPPKFEDSTEAEAHPTVLPTVFLREIRPEKPHRTAGPQRSKRAMSSQRVPGASRLSFRRQHGPRAALPSSQPILGCLPFLRSATHPGPLPTDSLPLNPSKCPIPGCEWANPNAQNSWILPPATPLFERQRKRSEPDLKCDSCVCRLLRVEMRQNRATQASFDSFPMSDPAFLQPSPKSEGPLFAICIATQRPGMLGLQAAISTIPKSTLTTLSNPGFFPWWKFRASMTYFRTSIGRLAQLVQSTSFTPRGSGVRVPHRPPLPFIERNERSKRLPATPAPLRFRIFK